MPACRTWRREEKATNKPLSAASTTEGGHHNPNPEKEGVMNDATLAPPPTGPKRHRTARARRGTGMLYQLRRRDGTIAPTWWTKLYINGRPVRESTGTTDREA